MRKEFLIKFTGDEPKYIELSRHIRKLIEDGIVYEGEKLPPIRGYSESLGVNNITLVNTYKKLTADGFAYQKMGSGTYAKKKDLPSRFMREYNLRFKKLEESSAECKKDIIDFAGETSEGIIFPIEDFKSILNNVLDRDGVEALTSKSVLGFKKLRDTINKVFWDNTRASDDILIVSGAQQGIDIASKAFININDNVVVEKPTYGGALSVFRFRRANIFEVNMEIDGIDIQAFEEVLKKNKIRAFYTMSYFQNPTGICYSLEKKKKILELANKYDFYIIEDDYLSELIYREYVEYIPFKWIDKDDRVVYIKSFSKIFLPGIRLGYMIPPKSFKESVRNTKFSTDIATTSLMQRALELYIREGQWKNNIEKLKVEYRERFELMNEEIDKKLAEYFEYDIPYGGVNFYLRLRTDKISSKELFIKCSERGVYLTPGVIFFRKEEEGAESIRIGFSQTNKEKIIKGIDIIREVISE